MPEIGRISAVLELDGRKFKGEMRQAVASVDRFGKNTDRTGKRAKRSFESVTGSVRSLSTGIKVLAGAAVLGLAVRQLSRLAATATEVSSSFNIQERSINAVSGSLKAGAENMAFVRQESQRLGVSTEAVIDSLKGLTIALRGTENEGAGTREIVRNFLSVNAIMGGTEEQARRVGRALSQMGTLGKISAEELNQLADAGIPAFRALRDLVQGAGGDFDKLQQKGKLLTKDLLLPLSREIAKSFGVDTSRRIVTFNSELGRVSIRFREALKEVGDFITKSPAVLSGLQSIQDGFVFIREAVIANRDVIEDWVNSTVTGATNIVKAFAGIEGAMDKLSAKSQVLVKAVKLVLEGLSFLADPRQLQSGAAKNPLTLTQENINSIRTQLESAKQLLPRVTKGREELESRIAGLQTDLVRAIERRNKLSELFIKLSGESTGTSTRLLPSTGLPQSSGSVLSAPGTQQSTIAPKLNLQLDTVGKKVKTVTDIIKEMNQEFSVLSRQETTVRNLGLAVSQGLGLETEFTDAKIALLSSTLGQLDPKAKGATREIRNLENELRKLFSEKDVSRRANQLKEDLDELVASTRSPFEKFIEESRQARQLFGNGEDSRVRIRLRQIREEYVKTIPAMRLFKQVSDTVFDGIATALDGVIRGTQSLEEAFKNLAQTITAQLANQALRKILELAGNAIVGGISSGIGGGAAPQSSGSVTAGPTPFSSAALNSVPSGPSLSSAGFARQETPTINVIMVPDENAADRQQREIEAIGQIVDRRFMKNMDNGPLGSTYMRALAPNRMRP